AGYTLLGDFVVGEAKRSGPAGDEESHRYARAQARLFDRLIVAIAQEYAQEERGRSRGVEHARAERVKRLLAGELVEEAELGYELGAWHLAVVATGPGSLQAFRDVAAKLDRRLLLVRPGKGAVWAWLGGARKVTAGEFAGFTSSSWPEETSLAIGEPAYGVTGWRLTHRQAVAALPILERGSERMVCYSDVALLASALRDEVLSNSLVQTYLAPLAKERDGGVNLRHTLRAYFDAAGNVSSAAAALDVSRQTVNSRLRTIEKRIGRPLRSCAAEVELALRLRSLSRG
ncbi:MAG TPA: helix-turn-helix domain-containing protein, partial [Solirubrobacterales bacterium]|nr:helix-turn-helix domain-containing protein [Solirubrobacterales bacterium]